MYRKALPRRWRAQNPDPRPLCRWEVGEGRPGLCVPGRNGHRGASVRNVGLGVRELDLGSRAVGQNCVEAAPGGLRVWKWVVSKLASSSGVSHPGKLGGSVRGRDHATVNPVVLWDLNSETGNDQARIK